MRQRNAIALLRVSSEAQAGPDRRGLPGQLRVVRQIAEAHDLEIVEEVEIRASGARVLEDSRFRRLLDRIDSPRIHGVIVADLDRLMRPEDPGYYSIFKRFRDTETVIYTSAGPKDFRTDRLLMMIESEIAALERDRIAERTRRGREEKRRQGKRAEGPVGFPRGVTFDREAGKWEYVWPEAERVRAAFRLWLASDGTLSFREINRRTGLVPPDSAEPSAVVSRLLQQPLYAGVYRVDRRWKQGKAVPREPHECYENTVLDPPLVSREEFDRAQELLARKRARRAPRRSHEEQGATYAGFLECSLCGASLWVLPDSKSYRGYCCGNARYNHCPTGRTSIRIADPQIDAALEQRLGDIDTLRRLIEKSAEEARSRAEVPPAEITRKLTQRHNQKERVKDAYDEGLYDLVELRKRLGKLDGEIALLESLLAEQEEPSSIDSEFVTGLVDVFSSWRDLRRDEKRDLIRAYQIRIRVSRPKRGNLSVDQVVIGVLGDRNNLTIYKKLKRYGMQ